MDIELSFKEKSFEFNVSPLMPIAYIRSLAFKTFKIPEQNIELYYRGIKIERQYYETYLKDYFPKTLKINIIIIENENKNPIKFLLDSTKSSSFKTQKISKAFHERKILLTTNDLKYNKLNSDGTKKMKCEECKKNDIEYYCREDIKFICSDCKINHDEHKYIEIKKGNIEQCGNLYKKILIQDLRIQEENLNQIIIKSKNHNLKDMIEELYDLISKIFHLKKDIMDYYPSIPLQKLSETDFKQISHDIFSIENNSKEVFNYKDKKDFFKQIQKQDFLIDSLKKDIQSVQKKYFLEDFLTQIISSYLSYLNNLYEELNKLWKNKRNNLLEFALELEELLESFKKNFPINQSFQDNNNNNNMNLSNEFDENKIEKILFENKKNKVLPRIKNSNYFPVLPNFNSILKSRNSSENKLNILTYDLDLSSEIYNIMGRKSITNSYNNFNNIKNMNNSSNNILSLKKKKGNYEKQRDSFKLDNVLLSEKDLNSLSPRRPTKRQSIRLSFYTKNKVHKITPAEIMKLKKKKKKKYI